jgi:hypothetical protein
MLQMRIANSRPMMPAAILSQAIKTSWQSFNTQFHCSDINTVFE